MESALIILFETDKEKRFKFSHFLERTSFYKLENNFICSRALARVPLELLKLLLGASSLGDLEHIESHSLAQGPALSNCDNVSDLYIPETGGQVHRHVLVTFLSLSG